MKASEALDLHREEIRRIILANKAENPRVFGSVSTGLDDEDSDLDILLDPTDGMDLFDLNGLANDLEELLHVSVDVITERSIRPRFRDSILSSTRPL